MKITVGARILFAGLLVLGSGCATTTRSPADQLVEQGDYEAAVLAYEAEESRLPDDPLIKRNHGIALFRAGRRNDAISKLQIARALEPENPQTLYFLGRAAEETGQTDLALASYTDYLAATGRKDAVVRAKVHDLTFQQANREIKEALEREQSIDPRSVPENTLAVSEFENSLSDPDLEALRHGLAAVLITDLSQVRELRVLERERLGVLLDEISLTIPAADAPNEAPSFSPIETVIGMKERLVVLQRRGGGAYYSGPIDAERSAAYVDAVKAFQGDRGLGVDGIPGRQTWKAVDEALAESSAYDPPPATERPRGAVSAENAPRVGKLLGARRFVLGSFAPLGDEEIQLGASLLEVAEGTQLPAGPPVVGPLPRVLRLEKTLVSQIFEALGVEPSEEERERIEQIPTEDFLAFLAYSRGLYLEDAGDFQGALDAYREAVSRDGSFQAAVDRSEILSVTSDDELDFDRSQLLDSIGSVPATDPGLLLLIGARGALTPPPGAEGPPGGDPYVDSPKVGESEAVIIVEGDLPGGKGGQP